MSPGLIRWLRYLVPALTALVVGVVLEQYVWQGRGTGA